MKNYVLSIALGLSLFFITSCRKDFVSTPDTNEPVTAQSVYDYFPLTPGNYWVYQHTYFDSSGNILPQSWKNDSIVVKNDTVIDGKAFHTVNEYNFLGMSAVFSKYYRDSADCIVDETGKIIFSLNEAGLIFKDILTPDTFAYVNYYFNGTPASITVPSGTYSCVDFRGELFRKPDNFSQAYLLHHYYSKDIGQIERMVIYVGALRRTNLDLLSYHVQ